ncbi:MAG: tetratricopeptide repeat protein [Candidatus Omnitrophica bacterium]|nr:tetratricopeptide repeat protein [Candidatus Omnitrophota bacterium]
MEKSRISLCMVVKNEEKYLPYCLKSVRQIVDEIVIVDTGSTDKTLEIAKRYGACIINYKWNNLTDLSYARNISLQAAKNNWVLVLDADESIAKKDLFKMVGLAKNNKAMGFNFTVRNYTNNFGLLQDWRKCIKEYPTEEAHSGCAGWIPSTAVRLFRKRKGILFENGLNETVAPSLQGIGKILESLVPIHHFQFLKGENFVREKQLHYLKDYLSYPKKYLKTPNYYFRIACVLLSYKRAHEKAIKYLKKAIAIDPQFLRAYPILGMAYKEKRKSRQAVDLLCNAIASNLKSADIFVVLGISYADLGMYKEGIGSLKKALEINPFHPLANNGLGVICANKGFYKEAIKEYRQAIKIHPFHPEAYYNMGVVYQKLGNRNLAIKAYKKALEINPKDKEARDNLKAIVNE